MTITDNAYYGISPQQPIPNYCRTNVSRPVYERKDGTKTKLVIRIKNAIECYVLFL